MNSKMITLSFSTAALFLAGCKQAPAPVKPTDGTAKIQGVHAAWHCPMHPQIVRDHPGNCPICGMDLVPLDAASGPVADTSRHADHVVQVDPAVLRKIGVRTDMVQPGVVGPALRVDAEGVLDEAAELSVTVRTMGYVETVAPLRTGDRVRKGQVLATFYSPDQVAAQGEWLSAKNAGDSAGARAGRERLISYGWTEANFAEVAKAGKVVRTLSLAAPDDGWISRRQATAGQSAMAGQELFRIIKGSGVLVDARVPQSRLAGLMVGSDAQISGAGLAAPVPAKVRAILPVVGASDRTATVRLEVQGANAIKLGGLYQVALHPKSETGLLIPDGAVLHSGTRDIVFLVLGEGKFEPKEVKVGPSDGGRILVREGLEAGDEIVVSAQFLLDGESRLQAALDQMQTGVAQ